MSPLLDSLQEQISPEVVRGLASNLGEPNGSVQKALQGGSAAMLATLASKAQDQGFLGQIMNLISHFSGRNALGAAAGVGTTTSSTVVQSGSTFLNTLFGGDLSKVTAQIAETCGIRTSSAGSVLAAAAPIVLGTLASKVNAQNLSVSGLGGMLAGELPRLRSFLPTGFSKAPTEIPRVENVVRPKGTNWLWPVVLLVLLLFGLIWFFTRNNSVDNAVSQTVATAQQAGNAIGNGAASLGAFVKSSLPDGVDLNIPQNGMESRLLLFITDPSAQVNNTTWFEFDRLLFDTSSATLQASSQEQLQNIANILRAYPNVHVRIGGYTDNQGDAAANQKLSQDRADSVMHQLVVLGVDPSHLDARGYGDDSPVADNATDAGRAQNRRIALRVTQK